MDFESDFITPANDGGAADQNLAHLRTALQHLDQPVKLRVRNCRRSYTNGRR